jgi:hypothetical protein
MVIYIFNGIHLYSNLVTYLQGFIKILVPDDTDLRLLTEHYEKYLKYKDEEPNKNLYFWNSYCVFASPVFHRWHHTGADEGGSKNFAATFSFLDHLFGTFYMPKDQKPMNLGLTDRDMPSNLLGQWLYPIMPSEPQQAKDAPAKPTTVQ